MTKLLCSHLLVARLGAAGVAVHASRVNVPPWTVGLARPKERPEDPSLDWLIDVIAEVAKGI